MIYERQCLNCGQVFKTNYKKKFYCSEECRYASQLKNQKSYRQKKAKTGEWKICKWCGELYRNSTPYCSDECREKYRKWKATQKQCAVCRYAFHNDGNYILCDYYLQKGKMRQSDYPCKEFKKIGGK